MKLKTLLFSMIINGEAWAPSPHPPSYKAMGENVVRIPSEFWTMGMFAYTNSSICSITLQHQFTFFNGNNDFRHLRAFQTWHILLWRKEDVCLVVPIPNQTKSSSVTNSVELWPQFFCLSISGNGSNNDDTANFTNHDWFFCTPIMRKHILAHLRQ